MRLVSESSRSGLGAQLYSLCLHAADNLSCGDEAGFLPMPATLHCQTGDSHGKRTNQESGEQLGKTRG